MSGTCPRCGQPTALSGRCTFCGQPFPVEAAARAGSKAENPQAADERITAAANPTKRILAADGAPEPSNPIPCEGADGPCNPSPRRMLAHGIGVAGFMAILGYCCGLIQGEGMQFALALWSGATGGFVVLLGYGPIAVVIGFIGALGNWLRGNKTQRCDQRSDSNDHAD